MLVLTIVVIVIVVLMIWGRKPPCPPPQWRVWSEGTERARFTPFFDEGGPNLMELMRKVNQSEVIK